HAIMQSNKRFIALFSSVRPNRLLKKSIGATVGAVYDRAVFPKIDEVRAVIDRAYSAYLPCWGFFSTLLRQRNCDDAVARCSVVVTPAGSNNRNILFPVLALIGDRCSVASSFQFHVPDDLSGF